MGIPVSSVVSVSISIGATFPARAGFGTLNIVTAETGTIGVAERIRSYQNLDGVVADWLADSEVVKAATAYFSQQPKPTSLKVSTRYPTAVAAQLRGGAVTDNAENLALFQAIDNGSATLIINGSEETIAALDLSSVASLDDVAADIQAAFTDITCTYDGNRFFINSNTTGSSSTISFMSSSGAGPDLSSLLKMQQGQATKSNGLNAETITASLNAIQNIDPDWYGLVFTKEVRDAAVVNGENAVEAAADWCEARIKIFGNTTNNLDALDSVTTTDILSVLKAKNLRRTISTYSSTSSQYPSASVLGRAFTVNFNQPNSTITLKFKQGPGITVEDLTQNEKAVLDNKRGNAFILVGQSDMYSESKMANNSFFDEVHGVDWLDNAIQTNVFGYLLTRSTKVPYTDKGVAALEQQVTAALDEAVRNGLIGSGETIDGEFLPNGYKVISVPVAEINQSDKEARHYGGLSFVALGAGAIHGAQINGTFER